MLSSVIVASAGDGLRESPVMRDVAVAMSVLLRVVPFDTAFLRFRRDEDDASSFSTSSSTDDEEEEEDRTDNGDE